MRRQRGRGGLEELRAVVRNLVDNDGITYIQLDTNGEAATNGDEAAVPGAWHLDALPLVISASDWDTLESGLVQRSRLLDAVLADLYGPRRSVTGGVFPSAAAVLSSRLPQGRARDRSAGQASTVHACLRHQPRRRRRVPGQRRLEPRRRRAQATHWPTDASSRTPYPTSTSGSGLAESPWAQALRLPLIDAAPGPPRNPWWWCSSPGIHSETAFDQAYLASVLGFPLVESADLVVRDGKLWMRSLGTLKQVDVVLRRVDADYVDPLDLGPIRGWVWSGWSRCCAGVR